MASSLNDLIFAADQRNRAYQNNPFARVESLGGRPVAIANSFGDVARAINFQNTRNQPAPSLAPLANYFSGAGLFQGAPQANTSTRPDGIEVLREPKDPGIASAVQSILGEIGGLSTDPNVRQGAVQRFTRSEPLQANVNQALQNFGIDTKNTRQSIADFAAQFLAATPQVTANTEQDIGAIGRFYGGPNSIESELAQIRNQQRVNSAANLQRQLGGVEQARNIGELRGLPSSYLTAQAMDAGGRLRLANDIALSDQQRADLMQVANAQASLAGRRQQLSDALTGRSLAVPQAVSQLSAANLAQLGQLSNLENSNNIFDLQTPQSLLAQQLGLLGSANQINLGNTFFGLKEPRREDASGILNVPRYIPQNNRQPFYPEPFYDEPQDYTPASGLTLDENGNVIQTRQTGQAGPQPTPYFQPRSQQQADQASAAAMLQYFNPLSLLGAFGRGSGETITPTAPDFISTDIPPRTLPETLYNQSDLRNLFRF